MCALDMNLRMSAEVQKSLQKFLEVCKILGSLWKFTEVQKSQQLFTKVC